MLELLRPLCLLCGLASNGLPALCPGCRRDLPRLPGMRSRSTAPTSAMHTTEAALRYAFPVDSLVQQLKFQGRLPVAAALGDVLAEHLENVVDRRALPDAIVPVPLHPVRQRERGFNQAERIATPVAKRLGIPVLARNVIRRRNTLAQSGIDRAARISNLHDAFSVVDALPPHVAIIDDVLTTGSTLEALAAALHDAGVLRVDAWVVARTL